MHLHLGIEMNLLVWIISTNISVYFFWLSRFVQCVFCGHSDGSTNICINLLYHSNGARPKTMVYGISNTYTSICLWVAMNGQLYPAATTTMVNYGWQGEQERANDCTEMRSSTNWSCLATNYTTGDRQEGEGKRVREGERKRESE